MIDYLKILIVDSELIQKIYNNPLLLVYSDYKKNNPYNEIKKATHTKEYKGMFFCFHTKDEVCNKLEILFKPHYYFNNNLHNANDFSVRDCIKTLNEIKDTFNLPVNELKIINIEFGLNFISPIEYQNLITYIYYHSKNTFQNSSDKLKYSKISFKHNENGNANTYKMIKIYAKGLQFKEYADINTIRYELKSKRSNYINSKNVGIKTYANLLKLDTYKTLAKTLTTEFENILIIDADNKKENLNSKEVKKLNEYLNPIKWDKTIQGYRNKFSKDKKKYLALLDKTENNIHTILKSIITKKLKTLLK